MIRAILTDIEGTTSSISFVKEVLFPYARAHMEAYLIAHWDEERVQEQVKEVARIGELEVAVGDLRYIFLYPVSGELVAKHVRRPCKQSTKHTPTSQVVFGGTARKMYPGSVPCAEKKRTRTVKLPGTCYGPPAVADKPKWQG